MELLSMRFCSVTPIKYKHSPTDPVNPDGIIFIT
jgi:hypothetical protein